MKIGLFTTYLLGILFFFGCSEGRKQESLESPKAETTSIGAVVTRGAQNQPIIKITGHTAKGEGYKADLLMAETDGYVSAQDRFMQMDILRRVGRGRLSELFADPKAAEKDRATIGIGLPWAVENSVARMQRDFPKEYDVLLTYAKGVNRFIGEIPTQHPQILHQFEMITGDPHFQIPLWEPRDSITVATNISFHLSSKLPQKMNLGIVSLVMRVFQQDNELDNMFDFRPIENVYIIGGKTNLGKPKAGEKNPDLDKRRDKNLKLIDRLSNVNEPGTCRQFGFPFPDCERPSAFGSNNWVVSKAFTGTNQTLLANDPHLPITFPSTFHEVSGDSVTAGGTLRFRGVRPPGFPGVLIGHNEFIAWGMTNLGADVDNIYVEDMKDASKMAYRWGKTFKPVKIIPFRLRKRLPNGGIDDSEIVKVKFTDEHGPIFSEHMPELAKRIEQVEKMKLLGQNLALSYRWVGHKGTPELAAIMALNRAHDFNEFKKSLDLLEVGSQNVVYADKLGNIGYMAHGLFPNRPYVSKGKYNPYEFVFSPAQAGAREWEGFRTQVPEAYKSDGYIVSANNDPWGHSAEPQLSNYNDYFGYDFTDGIRAARITQMLEETKRNKGTLDSADMERMQMDVKDLLAQRALGLVEKSKVEANLSPDAKAFLRTMLDWRDAGTFASVTERGPVYFYEWMPQLMSEHFRLSSTAHLAIEDDGGKGTAWDKAQEIWRISQIENVLRDAYQHSMKDLYVSSMAIRTIYHKINDGLDSKTPGERERIMTELRDSLETGAKVLREKGREQKRWGDINRVVFEDLLGNLIPEVFSFPVERPGAIETVNPSFPGRGWSASFRVVYTLEKDKPISAKFAIPGGNYNQFEPTGAIDEVLRWRDGLMRDLVPMPN